jgi:hypothetical protein
VVALATRHFEFSVKEIGDEENFVRNGKNDVFMIPCDDK